MRALMIPRLIALLSRAILVISTVSLGSMTANAQNLVRNGDFSKGYYDFLSGYEYADPVANALVPAGVFTVTRNPHNPIVLNDQGAGIFDFYDHTLGTSRGAFLVVNGAGEPNRLVWGQRIKVKPNTTYYFSTWVATWTPDEVSPAELQFRINGDLIGPVFVAAKEPGLWGVFQATWNSGNYPYADISIVNQNTTGYGNDFGLDDIVFQDMSLPLLKGRTLTATFFPKKTADPTPAQTPEAKPPSGN